jgi:NAD(P)-dependent dehydrogenase (short-subunit alcohol dehydrogenase family)
MSKQPVDISGRVVAITGAARGIGLATAKALRAKGAKVAIGDVDGDTAINAAASLGSDVLAASLDVTDPSSFRDFLALTERELGPIDVLINNAGIMPIGPFLNESHATAQRVFDIDVLGVMTGMKLGLPAMLKRGSGHIVNVASVAGTAPVPGGASYAAAKAAVISLTETARVEFAKQGVAFTAVMPSFTATDLILGTKGTRLIPTIKPEDVAGAIVGAIETQKKDVYVPKVLAPMVWSAPLIGRRVRDFMNHLIRADRTFLEVDQGVRASYDARISRPTAKDVVAETKIPSDSPTT